MLQVLKKENIFARNDPKDLQHTIAERNVLALVNNQVAQSGSSVTARTLLRLHIDELLNLWTLYQRHRLFGQHVPAGASFHSRLEVCFPHAGEAVLRAELLQRG